MNNPVGIRGSEGCKVLSYLPKKFFSFSWNAPPQFEEVRKSDHKTWVVVEFAAISEQQTEIRLTHLGWLEGEKWNEVYTYFMDAWDMVLNNLSKHTAKETAIKQTSKKVTGIGGVFFKCKDPIKLKEWYKTHLGFNTDEYGTTFEWRQAADSTKKGFTQWSPFAETTHYFGPSTQDFMMNYRVENLEQLVEQLIKEGVTIADTIETYEYGKFVHIIDGEGNKVELWEAYDTEYEKINGELTK